MYPHHLLGFYANRSRPPYLRISLLGSPTWGHIWTGNWAEAESRLREQIELDRKRNVIWQLATRSRELGLVLTMQNRFVDADSCFLEAENLYRARPLETQRSGVLGGFRGFSISRRGDFVTAQDELEKALVIKREQGDRLGIPELLVWLGQIAEMQHFWSAAERLYTECITDFLELRLYFSACALTGLIRVAYESKHFVVIDDLLNQAEQLAQRYEDNDQLAALRLIQGHAAWDSAVAGWNKGFDAAFHYFRQSLIYALRYNRFLLDEILSARNVHTPLRTIFTACLARGDTGQKMLIALREWWQTGTNDVGAPRPDTILYHRFQRGSLYSKPSKSPACASQGMARCSRPCSHSWRKLFSEREAHPPRQFGATRNLVAGDHSSRFSRRLAAVPPFHFELVTLGVTLVNSDEFFAIGRGDKRYTCQLLYSLITCPIINVLVSQEVNLSVTNFIDRAVHVSEDYLIGRPSPLRHPFSCV